MKTKLEEFVKTNRNYRPYSISRNIVEKVWNNGMGSIALFRFYPEQKTVLINSLFANKCDLRKLTEFCRDCGITDWAWKAADFGYPAYYFNTFSLSGCHTRTIVPKSAV